MLPIMGLVAGPDEAPAFGMAAFGTSPQGASRPWPSLRDYPVGSASRTRGGPATRLLGVLDARPGAAHHRGPSPQPVPPRPDAARARQRHRNPDRPADLAQDGWEETGSVWSNDGTVSGAVAGAAGPERPTGRAT